MRTMMRTEDSFRDILPEEVEVLRKILRGNTFVHYLSYCFCDEAKNLYSLEITREGNVRYITVLFIKPNVTSVQQTKELGYYEAEYPVYESLRELFSYIPEMR